MPQLKNTSDLTLVQEWPFPVGATLGSSVRTRGILVEIRARLPAALKSLEPLRFNAASLSKAAGQVPP